MNFAIKQYIDSNMPPHAEAVYNMPDWIHSVAGGGLGGNFINIPPNKNEERWGIIVHQIEVSPSSAVATATFYNQGFVPVKPIFTYSAANFIIADFTYLTRDSSLRIANDNVSVFFSFLYQTISLKKKNT